MRIRSVLLFACMIVVPSLAMFSHKIPRELRSAARERLWEPARRAVAGALDLETPPAAQAGRVTPPPTTGPAVTIAVAPPPALGSRVPPPPPAAASPSMVVMPPVMLAPIDAISAPASANGGLAVPASTVAVTAAEERSGSGTDGTATDRPGSWIPPEPPDLSPPAFPAPARGTATASAPTRPVDSEIRVRRAVEERLAALGAISFDCQPLQGTDGIHRCSCRVAADPTGQLQRVFQSSGPDPATAMSTLLDQVTAWKQRLASRPDQPPAATSIRFQSPSDDRHP